MFKLNNVPKYTDWHEKLKLIKEENCSGSESLAKLNSSSVLKTIYEHTKEAEPIVVTDVGQHQMVTAQFFNFNKPKRFITSGGLGTMGFGLPASIGAQLAKPNSLVLNNVGAQPTVEKYCLHFTHYLHYNYITIWRIYKS